MRSYFLITFVLVCCLQQISPAQGAFQVPSLKSNPVANDSTLQIAQLTPQLLPAPQPLNPSTGTTGPIIPTGTDLNNQFNPSPAPANELLPSDTGNVIETPNQKLWRLTFTFGTGVYYDDNIFITHTNKVSDTVFTLDAGGAFELGDYRDQVNDFLVAKYLVTGYLYSEQTNEDSADQNVLIRGQYRFSNFTFQTKIVYQYLKQPNRLVGSGNFVTQNVIQGGFRLLYDLSDKTQLHAEFEQLTNLYPKFLDTFEYIGRFGADYLITPKIKLGLEGVVGSLHQEGDSSNFYGQGRLRAAYQYTSKLTFRASVGEEVRHYSATDTVKGTPVFSLGVDYLPFVDTSVSLTAFRTVFASPLTAGDDFTGTGVQVEVSQKFLYRLIGTVAAGYENDKYNSTHNQAAFAGRIDNYVYIGPTLSYSFRNRWTATVYYQFSRNASNAADVSFTANRIGGQISVTL